jgi:type II secretory pathway component GspD/PulD (secretin)
MNALRCLLFLVCGWAWLALAAGQASGQQPPDRPGGAEKVETLVFRLKNMKASEAVSILREVLREEAGPKGSVSLGVDDRTNAVVVRGAIGALDKVSALLQKLDVPGESDAGERTEMKVLPLGRVEPDQALEEALRLVFGNRRPGRFVVDRRRHAVLVSGNAATFQEVKLLLDQLSALSEDSGEPSLDLSVRLFWLVSGQPTKDAVRLPDDLKEVAADLEKLGLDKPRLATQVLAHATLGTPFEVGGTAHLDAPYRLTFSGTVSLKKGAVGLDVTVNAERPGTARERSPVAGVRTQVTAAPGRLVVLGVTPTEKLTSAFVVQVEGKKPTAPQAKPVKSGTFHFQDKPWGAVLAWLGEQTSLPVVGNVKPTGTFTFVPPAGKQYTVAEMIDIINEALQMQKYILIRGERSLIVVPADEKIDPSLVPRVLPADLGLRGRTELVSVVLPVKSFQVDDIAPDVKKLLGPFGEVSVLKKVNQLVVQDTAGNVGRVYAMIRTLEEQGGK